MTVPMDVDAGSPNAGASAARATVTRAKSGRSESDIGTAVVVLGEESSNIMEWFSPVCVKDRAGPGLTRSTWRESVGGVERTTTITSCVVASPNET